MYHRKLILPMKNMVYNANQQRYLHTKEEMTHIVISVSSEIKLSQETIEFAISLVLQPE